MAADPTAAAQAWVTGMQGAGARITAGVQNVTVAPGAAAARQKAAYVQGVAQSADKWAKNVSAIPLSDWQQAVIQKGVPRIAGGATAAQPKMQRVMEQLIPQINAIVNGLPPRGTVDQNIQRAVAYMQAAHKITINK